MLKTRILSALVMAPPVLAAGWAGEPWFNILVALIGAGMAWEWTGLCRRRFGWTGMMLATVLAATAGLASMLPLWMLAVLVAGTGLVWRTARAEGRSVAWLAAGVLYLGVPLVAMVWLRADGGWQTLLWLLAVVWGTDIGAYAAGRTLGGPLLLPRISPKKTWSGLLGGMASAALASWGVLALLGGAAGGAGNAVPLWVIGLAPVLAVIAQAGDLFESSIKRRFDVKDSSNIIPGHGGILDRVDGLLSTAPVVALVVLAYGGGIGMWQ